MPQLCFDSGTKSLVKVSSATRMSSLTRLTKILLTKNGSLFYPCIKTCTRAIVSVSQKSKDVQFEKLTESREGIAVLSLNRIHGKNSLSRDFLFQLRDNLAQINSDSSLRVLVIRSTVEGVFCAGADLKERLTMAVHEVKKMRIFKYLI